MMVQVRNLWELGATLVAEERVLVGKSVSVKPVLRSLKGEGADAVTLHAATFFKVEQQT